MVAFLIQFASLFAIALWVGAGAGIGFLVAPAIFQRAGSPKLAGEIVGEILSRFDTFVAIAGPIACLATFLEMAATPNAARTLGLKLALVVAMLGLALYSRFAILPQIHQARRELGENFDQLDRSDPRRRAFGRLHGYSVLCMLTELVLGALAIGLTVIAATTTPHR
jgi:putative copper export protein